MEKIYDNAVDVKTLSSSSSTIQEGPRRLLRASVLGLGLLSVFLLAGLIGLAVHYHNSVGVRDQRINQLVDRLQSLMAKTCPEGWRMFGCSCYNLSTEKASWEQSRDNCRARGAHLVTVDSNKKQEFISSMIKEALGLVWDETQPDNGEGDRKIGEEDCVNISPSAWWNDGPVRTICIGS
ncbi:C-type lectin domain family 6 member A-like, partial [Trematomus bernacchii]|uniref:C-type lectin domain family 6 member A-like n=1 Tax=Trematomus bernacchii TaxID=40690 RepID=UPI001469D375